MDLGKLQEVVDALRDKLGGGLISCDIWGPDGLSLAGHNPRPEAVALFADLSSRLRQALDTSGFPPLDRYYFLELEDRKAVCVLFLGDHQFGCLIDLRHVVMGKLITIVLPPLSGDLRTAIGA